MKKLVKLILFPILIIFLGTLIFFYSYKLDSKDFITDKITIIYNNQNINIKNLQKIEQTFNLKKINKKEYIEKIKEISIISESKDLRGRSDQLVGIIDTGLYFPIVYRELQQYFDYCGNDFYRFKEEFKNELNLREDLYATFYRGLFFIGFEREEIKTVIEGRTKNKLSLKSLEIIENNKFNDLGVVILNQEKERLFGIDQVVVTGNIKTNKLILTSEIYGDNEIIKDFQNQPKNRKLDKYIKENMLYLSTINLNNMDTFLKRYLSIRDSEFMLFNEFLERTNGEIIFDMISGTVVIGLNNREENHGKDFVVLGEFSPTIAKNKKNIKENQFLSYEVDLDYYGKVEINGYCEKNKLKIISIQDIEKLGGKDR